MSGRYVTMVSRVSGCALSHLVGGTMLVAPAPVSGAQPSAASTVDSTQQLKVADAFDRSVSGGLDVADVGGEWSHGGRRSNFTMTWLLGPVEVYNNVIASPQSGNCLLCAEDYSQERTAEQIGVQANSNVYNRRTTSAPQWVVVWSRGAGNPAVFTDLPAFRASTGQEANGSILTGTSVVDSSGRPTSAMPSNAAARPLPSDLADLTGQATGARHLGAWV
jgi:hypothetical protein